MPDEKALNVPQELLILGGAVQSGIIETLSRNELSSKELAEKLNFDAKATWVILEALEVLGYATRNDGKYTLSPIARKMIYEPEAKEYIGFSFMHRYLLVKTWTQIPEVLKNGKPAPRDPDPLSTFYFIDAMKQGARYGVEEIVKFLMPDGKRGIKILDIGGGPLIHSKIFAKHGAKVTVQDLEEVVTMAKPEADKYGIELIPGDFNETLPPGPYDLAYLGNICHIIDEEGNKDLIQRVGKVVSSGGQIAIVDFIRGTTPWATIFGVNMLVNTPHGGTYTLEQYTDWCASAGFEKVTLTMVAERQIITALKK